MKTILELIKENKPNLSAGSLRTYHSILKNIYKRVYPDDDNIDIRKFKNCNDFVNHLKDEKPNIRKTILAALLTVYHCDQYKTLMTKDTIDHNEILKNHLKTDDQVENWVTQDDIKNLYTQHEQNVFKMFKMKNLSPKNIQYIQQFIILCLTSGLYIPPRRSLDWTELKWKNYDRETDNFYDKRYFVFNKYKTSKFYKTQKVEVPLKLKLIINKWIQMNPTEYLLFDKNNNKLNAVKLNQRINSLFGGKKISVNLLRHSYITDLYLDKPFSSLGEMKDRASKMGHNLETHLEYIKKDDNENE
jgi:hypothetical protein